MRKRARQKRSFGIRSKMILAIYLVLLPVLLVSCAIIYYTSYTSTHDVSVRQYRNAVKSIEENIGYYERDLTDIATYITVNDSILYILRSDPELTSRDPLFWLRNSPIEMIRSMMAVKNHIATLILYPESGLMPVYISRDTSVHQMDIERVRQTPIYERTVELLGADLWSMLPESDDTLFDTNRSNKVVLSRELFDLSKRNRLGFLALSVYATNYEQVIRGALLGPDDGAAVIGKSGQEVIVSAGNVDGEVLAHLIDAPLDAASTESAPLDVGGYSVFARQRSTGDMIYYLTPKASWTALIRSGLIMPILVGIALLFCVFPLSAFATRIITKPVKRLSDSMNKFSAGDFGQQVEVVGSDEIASLSAMFNRMVLDISDLIDKNYVMVLREKESELNALQAQINPHFLYNALDSLYWQAVESGSEQLADNILTLSDLFRFLLSSGQNEVTVQQEIKIVSSYLSIQKMRFGKRLSFAIDVAPELMSKRMPKLLIQPFVENAIVHGLESTGGGGTVRVTGRLTNDIMHFTIEDNGAGMAPEVLGELKSSTQDVRYANQRVGHFAIANVRERLSIRYGERARFMVTSALGEGTVVTLKIPADM